MALCPFASQRPVSAHGGAIQAILGVVIHVTAGEGDPYNEFANPNNKVSSHFGIGNGQGGMADGLIEQYVDTGNQSWAQAAGNATYISVETEGEPTDPLTPAQVRAFGKLYAWLHTTHGIPFTITDTPGNHGFITHGDGGAAWGGHTGCPGPARSAQRQAILNAAEGVTPPAPPIPSTKEYKVMDSVVAQNGDIVSHAVTPAGHWLELTRVAGKQGHPATDGLEIIDITAQFPQFVVQP